MSSTTYGSMGKPKNVAFEMNQMMIPKLQNKVINQGHSK